MKYPIREKYIDEKVGVWYAIPKASGNFCVDDGREVFFDSLTEEMAKKLVEAQKEFRKKVYDLIGLK